MRARFMPFLVPGTRVLVFQINNDTMVVLDLVLSTKTTVSESDQKHCQGTNLVSSLIASLTLEALEASSARPIANITRTPQRNSQ